MLHLLVLSTDSLILRLAIFDTIGLTVCKPPTAADLYRKLLHPLLHRRVGELRQALAVAESRNHVAREEAHGREPRR